MLAAKDHVTFAEAMPGPSIVGEWLRTREYEQFDEALAQVQRWLAKDSAPADIIRAVQQIAQLCSLSRDMANWYQWAFEETLKREEELAQLLARLYDTLSVQGPEGLQLTCLPGLLSSNGHKRSEPANSKAAKRAFWQTIQGFLGRESTLDKPDETLVIPMIPADEWKADTGHGQTPELDVYCLGEFRAYQNHRLIENWPNRKSKSVFKYLLLHRKRPLAKEVLMDLFWPSAAPEAARNSLNVAIYNLRQTLREQAPAFSHLLFQEDNYLFNPELRIWVDVEDFTENLNKAQQFEHGDQIASAIDCYSAAEELYQGDLFEDDRYEDWINPERQKFRTSFLELLQRLSEYYLERSDLKRVITVSRRMLHFDSCHEEAHRHLMECYSRMGQHHLALRQYHLCSEALKRELDVSPSPLTVELYTKLTHAVG
jgi:DNA-binding SARP family transcriptional activator